MASTFVEQRQRLVQRHLAPVALAPAKLLVRSIRDDAVEPGPERRLAAERVDLLHHGPERILHDFLRVLAAAGDPAREPIRTLALSADQPLRGHGLATPQRLEKVVIAVDAWTGAGPIGLSFEHHLKIHVSSSPPSVNVRSSYGEDTDRGRTLLPDVGWVGLHPTLVGCEPYRADAQKNFRRSYAQTLT